MTASVDEAVSTPRELQEAIEAHFGAGLPGVEMEIAGAAEELDETLTAEVVDKHSFYSDPARFDAARLPKKSCMNRRATSPRWNSSPGIGRRYGVKFANVRER